MWRARPTPRTALRGRGVRRFRAGVTVAVRAPKRLMLKCGLCEPEGMYVEPTSRVGLYAAVDHALDWHRDELLMYPHETLDEVIVTC